MNCLSFYYNISIQNKLRSREVEVDIIFDEYESEESKNDIAVCHSDSTDFFLPETTFNSNILFRLKMPGSVINSAVSPH